MHKFQHGQQSTGSFPNFMIKVLVSLVLLGFITGCNILNLGQSVFSQGAEDVNSPKPLQKISATVPVSTAWSTKLGSALEGTHTGMRPAFSDGVIYAAGTGGTVKAIEALTGKVLWTQNLNLLLSGGPGVSNDLVVLGGYDGVVVALEAKTGQEKWRNQVTSEILAAPAVDSDYVAVRSADGRTTMLSAIDGQELWFDEQEVPRLSVRGYSAPVLIGGILISAYDNGKLIAFNPVNGMIAWQSVLGIPRGKSELERLVDIDGNFEIVETDIYVAGYQSRLGKIDGRSGRLTWGQDLSSSAGLGVDSENIYVTNANDTISAFGMESGQALWSNDDYNYRSLTAPMPVAGSLIAGDYDGYVHVLSSIDGSTQARVRLSKAAITSTPLILGSLAIVQADDGKLAAYRIGE